MPTLLLAGANVKQGEVSAVALVLVITLASLVASSVWFVAGRLYGGRVLRVLCKLSLSADTCVTRTESAFTKYGRWSLVLGRFIPGVSLVAPPLAGALGMRWPVFLALTAAGAALYAMVLVFAGMLFSGAILALAAALRAHGAASATFVILVCVVYAAWKWWRRRHGARSLEAPRIGVQELKEALRRQPAPLVVDVRGDGMRAADARVVPGALAATVSGVVTAVQAYPRSSAIVVYCACPNDASAAKAVQALMKAGYTRASALRGGLDAWFESADSP
jgi:membrane protein DedA with SNARE-associated domain/rhodanese-related sulfurtransferase